MLNSLLNEVNRLFASDAGILKRMDFVKVRATDFTGRYCDFRMKYFMSVLANFIEKLNKVNESVKISACVFYYY